MEKKVHATLQEIVEKIKEADPYAVSENGIIMLSMDKFRKALQSLPTQGDGDIPTIAYLKGVEDGKALRPPQDEREVLKAEDYIKSQAHFCKWIDELTANEYSHLKDMLNEFYEINKQPTQDEREVLSKDELIDIIVHGIEYGWDIARVEANLPKFEMDVNYIQLKVDTANSIIDRYLAQRGGGE